MPSPGDEDERDNSSAYQTGFHLKAQFRGANNSKECVNSAFRPFIKAGKDQAANLHQ